MWPSCFYVSLGKKTVSFSFGSFGISYISHIFPCVCVLFLCSDSFGRSQGEVSASCLSCMVPLVTWRLVLVYSCLSNSSKHGGVLQSIVSKFILSSQGLHI